MTRISFVLFAAAACACAALQSGGASSNGIWVQYETKLEPPSPPISHHGGGVLTENNIIKRHLCNFSNKTYIGYDLTVEAVGDGRYKLRIAPLTITPAKMDEIFSEARGWSALPLPAQPVTQTVRAGETIAFDLLVNPSTGQRVVEYLRIKGNDRQVVTVTGPARDFTPADAEIEISEPRISVNGELYKGTEKFRGGVSGPAVWMDLDGHGRFVFSLAPRPDLGLHRAGEIRGTTMTWRSGGNTYTITTDKRITTGSGAYFLYVFHDPNHRPPAPLPAGSMGLSAGPKPEAAFRRM
jgi:hypothetical protein